MLLKKIVTAFFICFISIVAFSQNDTRVGDYVNQYKEIAIKEMMRTGVPASITLAQGILESQSGESDLAKRSNNHFGIKCKPEWTGDRTYHDDDAKGECFRVYTTVEQSYADHSDFLKNRPYYTFLFQLDPTDYEGWAKGLKKAGYATSPTYAQKLIDLIQRYNLQDYTLVALQRSKEQQNDLFAYSKEEKTTTPVPVVQTIQTDTPAEVTESKVIADSPVTNAVTVKVETETPKIVPAILFDAAAYPGSPFTLNSARVILAKEGTSLLALANEFKVSYKRLLEFNDLDETSADILAYDQLIFLSQKSKKGTKDTHVVEKNETMEVIAQKEGVQLKSLLEYNRIPKGKQPATGEKIYLRANSPVTPKLVASN